MGDRTRRSRFPTWLVHVARSLGTLAVVGVSCEPVPWLFGPPAPDMAMVVQFPDPDLGATDLAGSDSSCSDGIRDGFETDVDCGGPTCAPCQNARACLSTADCVSGNCYRFVCEPNTACWDNIWEKPPVGFETDTDCGGPVCPHCGNNFFCLVDGDCQSGLCKTVGQNRVCVPPGKLTLSFAAPVEYPVAPGPDALVAADFNRDGLADVATSSEAGTLSIYLGSRRGTLTPTPARPTSGFNYDIVAGVFTRDPQHPNAVQPISLAVKYLGANGVGLMVGNGDGTFADPIDTAVPSASGTGTLAAGDLDGDRFLDLVIPSSGGPGATMSFLKGSGTGRFVPSAGPVDVEPAGHLLVVDVNRDNLLDVLTSNSAGLKVWRGDGHGNLSPPSLLRWFEIQAGGCAIATYDFRRDGVVDVLGGTGDVFIGRGNGEFGAATNYRTGEFAPKGLAMADFDRDGFIDFAVGEYQDGRVDVMLGLDPPGSFGVPNQFPGTAGKTPSAVTAADVNGDDLPDILLTDSSMGRLLVIINNSF